ncbi:MAG: hypothetical protein IPM46_01085 [Flavobacteriales bacterium]|nr:hypothetical protein [Flavobacteriales bacterium]
MAIAPTMTRVSAEVAEPSFDEEEAGEERPTVVNTLLVAAPIAPADADESRLQRRFAQLMLGWMLSAIASRRPPGCHHEIVEEAHDIDGDALAPDVHACEGDRDAERHPEGEAPVEGKARG